MRLPFILPTLLLLSCPAEKTETPPAVVMAAPVKAVPPVAVAPETPRGLDRSKVGDFVEFSWRHQESKDLAADTGTVRIVRVEPASPFTFVIEMKSGENFQRLVLAYITDVMPRDVRLHVDDGIPKSIVKAAGVDWTAQTRGTKVIDASAASLALSGGLLFEKAERLSVELTKFGSGDPAVAGAQAEKLVTLEPPIVIAIQRLITFGVVGEIHPQSAKIVAATTPCIATLKPAENENVTETLEGVLDGDKLATLKWKGTFATGPFDTCVRQALKKLKLPPSSKFTLSLSNGVPMDDLH